MTTTRRLLLLRHAKAEPAHGVADEQRPLTLEGRQRASAVGPALVEAGLVPEVVLCSPAVRTRQTWELVRAGLSAQPRVEHRDSLYGGSPGALLDEVRAVSDDVETVLVVGHEPIMSRTAAVLAGPGSDETAVARVRTGVPTASWSVLEWDDVPWSAVDRGNGRLVRLVTRD